LISSFAPLLRRESIYTRFEHLISEGEGMLKSLISLFLTFSPFLSFSSFVSLSVVLCLSHASAKEKLQESVRLIVRGDDLGMTQGSIDAFEQAIIKGVLTCASIQVPAPWFEAAVELTERHPAMCYGIHLTLIGEWRGYRWRPVLPYNRVPSLVDEDGYLHNCPENLLASKPKVGEVEAELRAQIDLAKKKGVPVSYLDFHYLDVGSLPGCENIVPKLAREYGLPVSMAAGESLARGKYLVPETDELILDDAGVYNVPVEQKLESAIRMLEELEPGLWLWICHPGTDTPEQNALIHSFAPHIIAGPGVGGHRAVILDILTDIAVKSTILRNGIILTDYKSIDPR
jgi:predicted glycoside hydrolase/deacetylase ChbG (UPF0249 family)